MDGTIRETRCEKCQYYAVLKTPFHYVKDGYPVGVTVYGFCAKNAKSRFVFYPVYLPDGGVCKDFRKRRNHEQIAGKALGAGVVPAGSERETQND